MEYRKFKAVLNQVSPQGSLRQGFGEWIVWYGTDIAQLDGYENIAMTPEEVIEFEAPVATIEEDVASLKRLVQTIVKPIIDNTGKTEQDLSDVAKVYPYWNPKDYAYNIGDYLTYKSGLFEVIKAHLSTPSEKPDKAITLYTEITA